MTEDKKTYLVDVVSNLDEYAADAAKAKQNVDALATANKELKKSSTASTADIEKSNAALKDAQVEYKKAQKLVELQTKVINSEAGSRKQLGAMLDLERQKLGKVGEAYIKNEKGMNVLNPLYVDQRNKVKALANEIQKYDKALGDGRSSIGLYSEALEGAKGALAAIPGPIGSAVSGFKSMKVAMMGLLANPVGLFIAAIVLAVTALVKIFKTFDPVVEKIEQGLAALGAAFKVIQTTVVGLFTGQVKLKDAFKDTANAMGEAVTQAIALKKAEQDLEDMNILLIESEAKSKRQIDELLLQSKDRTKSETERIALIDQALAIEETQYEAKKKIADEELRLAQESIINGRDFTDEEIRNLKELGSEYAIKFQLTKAISKEEITTLANAVAKQENILDESVMIREKAINRQNVLEDKRLEDSEKRIEKEKALKDKETQAYVADLEIRLKLAEGDYEKQKQILAERFAYEIENENISNNQKLLLRQQYNDALDALFIKAADAQSKETDSKLFDINRENAALKKAAVDKKNYTKTETALSKRRLSDYDAEADGTANALGAISSALGEQTAAGKAFAIAQATINTYLAASMALKDETTPSYYLRVANFIAAIVIGLANVKSIMSVSTSGGSGGGGGGSSSIGAATQRISATAAATPTTSILQNGVTSTATSTATASQAMTGNDIVAAIAQMPAPVVSIEAIEAKTKDKKKVETRATI